MTLFFLSLRQAEDRRKSLFEEEKEQKAPMYGRTHSEPRSILI